MVFSPRFLRAKATWRLVKVAFCVGCYLAASAAAGATGAAAQQLSVTAWLPYWEMPAALNSTLDNANSIGTASPYWYDISGDATVHAEKGAGSPTVIAQLLARHQKLVPMVTEEAGMSAFARILASKSKRAALTRTLVKIASHPGYSGIDIDFESFAYDPQHRTALANSLATQYPELIAQTCSALRQIGRSCQVAVMARTTGAHIYAHGDIPTWVYDYKTLAAAADRIQLMAYDDHSPGGPAGPIAPLPWVKQVIAYARSQAPPSRYELGIPAYGYDWYGRTSATAVYANQVSALLAQTHAHPHWDAMQAEETFSFRQNHHKHVVWIDDAAAGAERATLAARAGFAGVAVWAAGYEQPQLWSGLDLSNPR
jgi:spore germination protein YaaH